MTIFKTALVAIVLACSMSTKADIITLEFEAVVFDGTFAGESGTGTISFDDTDLLLIDEEFLGFSGSSFVDFEALTDFSFTFLGQRFDQTNDLSFPDTPVFSLFDGFADSLDFFVEDGNANLIENALIVDFQIFGDFLGGGLRDSANGFDFEVDLFITERVVNNANAPYGLSILALLFAFYLRKVKG
ncbi:hypothetical protein [Glaciecola petra]|uniref:PEP-CTERM sorting domain-containing protein n=1 Tax=Glaciecola petra TaxID=3075602 RepID=A0ABU2ZQN1_9ALTE|nr:hypothetical protein [Aestuariibacter sp. P117]MDT0594943.1 hypothetical protein [Aestuariibacter sp. P117]